MVEVLSGHSIPNRDAAIPPEQSGVLSDNLKIPSAPEDDGVFDSDFDRVLDSLLEGDGHITQTLLSGMPKKESDKFIPTLMDANTAMVQRYITAEVAGKILGNDPELKKSPDKVIRGLLQRGQETFKGDGTLNRAIASMMSAMTPEYMATFRENIKFATEYRDTYYSRLQAIYKNTSGREQTWIQKHSTRDVTILLSLRNTAEARKHFFEHRLLRDQYLRNATGDYVVDGNLGDAFMQKLFNRRHSESAETVKLPSKSEQTARFLHSMATTWKDRTEYGIPKKKNEVSVVIFHQKGDDVYPLQLTINTATLPNISDIASQLQFLDDGTLPENSVALSPAVRMSLRDEAFTATPLKKKSKLFQKIAHSADIMISTNDLVREKDHPFAHRESPSSLFLTFQHATFHADLTFLHDTALGDVLNGVTLKSFHPDINGMPARRFLRKTMLQTYAGLDTVEQASQHPFGKIKALAISTEELEGHELSPEDRRILSLLPQDMYAHGTITNDQLKTVHDRVGVIAGQHKISLSIPRLIPLSVLLGVRPDTFAAHYIVDGKKDETTSLDVAIATLLPPKERAELIDLYRAYSTLDSEEEREEFIYQNKNTLRPLVKGLKESLTILSDDTKDGKELDSLTAVMAGVAGKSETILSGIANTITDGFSDPLTTPGAMISPMMEYTAEGDQTHQHAVSEMTQLGIEDTLKLQDVWEEQYVSTAFAGVYRKTGRHAGVMGVTVAHKKNVDGTYAPQLNYTMRVTYGHLYEDIVRGWRGTAFASEHEKEFKELIEMLDNRPSDPHLLLNKLKTTASHFRSPISAEELAGAIVKKHTEIMNARVASLPVAMDFLTRVLQDVPASKIPQSVTNRIESFRKRFPTRKTIFQRTH